jgi:hypothetical protein
MRGNQLIFSASGDRRKLYPVSPYLFSQHQCDNWRYLPDDKELPLHGMKTQTLVFDFGFSLPAMIVGPMDSQFFPFTLPNNFLGIAAAGVSDVPPSQNVTTPAAGALAGVQISPAYLVNIQQTHNGNTWQWFNKDITADEAVGTGEHPLMFTSPIFLPAGDTVSCIVRNLGNTSLRAQITILGASF